MSAGLHPRLAGPPPRGTRYCVDCYADGGKVSVATRMFGDDELCERHYLALCKEMDVEPDVITLSEAQSAKQMGQPAPIKKIRQASGRRPGSTATTPPIIRPESVAMRRPTNVLQLESIEGHGGNQSAVVTIENSFPSDFELAEIARSLKQASTKEADRVSGSAQAHRSKSGRPPLVAENPSSAFGPGTERQRTGPADSSDHSIYSTSQRPDSPVAPAAEDAADRAHKPDSAVAAPVSRSSSAANSQPKKSERKAKPMRSATALRNTEGKRVCSCGCGIELRSRHPYIKGHNKTAGSPAAPTKRGRPRNSTDAPPQQKNGHSTPLPAMAPVAIATNGNGRESVKITGAVSEFAMDKIWVRLSPAEKFDLLFPQEPSHA